MPHHHIVQEGEHLLGLATRYGFSKGERVLEHPDNAPLRGRTHPNILDVGEAITIPDRVPKEVDRATGKSHPFVVRRPKAKLKVVVRTFRGDPSAATEGTIVVTGEAPQPLALSDGAFELPVPPTAAAAEVELPAVESPHGVNLKWTLRPGRLGRIEGEAGLFTRLRNMGYYRRVNDDVDERERRSAVEEFQADNGLTVTGALDDATRAKIEEIHGC